jgi:hypothetical protein
MFVEDSYIFYCFPFGDAMKGWSDNKVKLCNGLVDFWHVMLVAHGASFIIVSIALVACMKTISYLLLHEDYSWLSTL